MLKRLWPLLLLAVLLVGVWKFGAIRDWWFLRSYQPPVEIAALADQTAMTDSARRTFYLADPQLDEKLAFKEHCPVTERGLVLGCYTDRDIYLLKVDRQELKKVMDVSAAHEMLHAAYDRLGRGQRDQVDGWLYDYFATSSDQDLKDLVADYDRNQPGTRATELHSLVGTQSRNLPPELEQYYQRYFANRAVVVDAYDSYEEVFRRIEAQQNELEQEIARVKTQLDNLEDRIEREQAQLEATNSQMDAYQASGNITAYNALVPTQNTQVRQYNSDVARYKSLVEHHNQLVEDYNTLAVRQSELVESLDASKFNTR